MTDPLLHAFAAAHPDEMAAQLSTSDTESLLNFLPTLDPKSASAVLSQLPSRAIGSCLVAAPPGQVAEWLQAAGTRDATALVAHLPNRGYREVLDASGSGRRKVARALRASAQGLSSLTTTDFIRARASDTCAGVRRELEASAGDPVPLFVVDDDGQVLGVLPAISVIAEQHQSRFVREFVQPVKPLRDSLLPATAVLDPAWKRHPALPIVDAAGQLVGALEYDTLRTLTPSEATRSTSALDTLSELAMSYVDLLGDLLTSIATKGRR